MRIFFVMLSIYLLGASLPFGQQEKGSKTPDERSSPEQIKKFNDEQVAALLDKIAGKENQPAELVFKNIKILAGVPAGNLLKIMQMGYSRSLGVSCLHCHLEGQWERDDKPTKQITREMSEMDHDVIAKYLSKIDGIKDRDPIVNCTTCHRGHLKPALNLDTEAAKQ
jgi:photosynthetic reaction center cytochrome c subunit